MLKAYYNLAKPGIIYGNLLPAIAGFFLAAGKNINIDLLAYMLIALGFVIGSGCVFNNIHDAEMDSKMPRTNKRALVTGIISKSQAYFFGTLLLIAGGLIFYFYTNILTLSIAILGWIFYVLIYTPLKSKTVFATEIGSIAGAVPPVVGYTAFSNKLDAGAWILFFILVLWQMPHFYAIAIYRMEDYKSAGVPVLPLKLGLNNTKIRIIIYTSAFLITSSLLYFYKYTGLTYLVAMLLISLVWIKKSLEGLKNTDNVSWAKKVFLFSLTVLTVFSIITALNALLP